MVEQGGVRMPETILVGIDSSTPSRSAIAWSVARAVATGASVELLHVIEGELLTEGSAEAADLRTHAQALVRTELSYARSLDPTLAVIATIAEGRPADVLARMSKGYALLVVGTHKTGFIYGRAFGSRFLGLGWRSRCDVAFIPDRVGYDRRGIVAGIDDSATGDAVLLFAASEAARSSQELVLVSSWGSVAHPPHSEVAVLRRAAMLSRAVRLARESQAHLQVRTRAVERQTAEALIESSANATLLVIGRRRTSRAGGSSRAANHDVLLNMTSPVIVVLDDRISAPVPLGTNGSGSSASLLRA